MQSIISSALTDSNVSKKPQLSSIIPEIQRHKIEARY